MDSLTQRYAEYLRRYDDVKRKHEEAVFAAAIAANLVPDPRTLPKNTRDIWLYQLIKLSEQNILRGFNGLSVPDLQLAWARTIIEIRNADRIDQEPIAAEQGNTMARTESAQNDGSTTSSIDSKPHSSDSGQLTSLESPRADMQIKATAVDYGVKKRHCKKYIAAALMNTSTKTYAKYDKREWLLSERDFKRMTGQSVEQYWYEHGGT